MGLRNSKSKAVEVVSTWTLISHSNPSWIPIVEDFVCRDGYFLASWGIQNYCEIYVLV